MRGDFATAIQHYQTAVMLQPQEAAYHADLAAAADGAGQESLVERHAAEALRLDLRCALAHLVMARWFDRSAQQARAIEHSARAVALDPNKVNYVILHATLLFTAGRTQEACAVIEPALAAGSTDRWLASLYARMAPSLGQEEAALAVVERVRDTRNLGAGPAGQPLLHFAACSLLDKMGRYDEAFGQARLGNELLRAAAPAVYNAAEHSAWVDRKIDYFTPERTGSLPRATHDSRRPLFILGMPRSGTTLVEQILACHPSVFPGGELQSLRDTVTESVGAPWAAGAPYPQYFDDMSLGQANRIAARYLADLDALNRDARYVTDKQPWNFLILDIVELMFPQSKVIHCVRGAMDTCVSCYTTNFEQPNPFKYDLADLGAFYRDYVRLMRHWNRVLTVPILEVRYEDLVLDTPMEVRRILNFLELPWDERCLKHYENKRSVRTASVDQVRRPIYTASIGRWKHYEAHLGPLIAAMKTAE